MFIRCLSANIKCLPTGDPLAEKLYECAGCGVGEIQDRLDIIFWISSVFKSDRVLAINDDAVFSRGRAALII